MLIASCMKKEAHWPSISSAHQCEFHSALCPLVEESWKFSDSTSSSEKHLKWWKTHKYTSKWTKIVDEKSTRFFNWWEKWLKTFQNVLFVNGNVITSINMHFWKRKDSLQWILHHSLLNPVFLCPICLFCLMISKPTKSCIIFWKS